MVQMSQVIFDKPYPLPQKRPWKLTTLQRLLSRFYQKRRYSRHEHTGLLSRGRDKFPRALDASHHFFYKRHKLVSPPGSAPLNLHPRSYDCDRRSQNENSSSSLFVEPSRGLCPSTLCIALIDATDISQSTGIRRTNSFRNLRALVLEAAISAKADAEATCNTSTVSVPEMPTKFLIDFLEGRAAVENLDHFNSFLIVRPTAQGDRVLYASEFLWAGEDFENEEHFLHHKRALDQTNDIVTEITDDGNERVHLMLFGGLPSTGGCSGLVLGSLINVTHFLDALTYSDLEIDVLIRHINSTSPQDVGTENMPENPSETSDVMRQLVNHVAKSILALYKDYFILSQSANAPGFYEISHVSPNLYVDGEYMTGHLSHTPQDVITRISQIMGQGKRFFLEVKWGRHGRAKRLYCIPMLTMGRRLWLCMLVDLIHPILWQEE
ncbi:hypothetical protein ACJ73_05840 [Blastomyces percursus]|uniref:Uncharacterized protein n=1 Tax=Blastomyces percursus TaxID=1658174 RepID=A0A1J9QRH2_9EURO|nr:hypothetical protein ACJ73_05840 [Blastomyces percursus]